MPIKAGTRLRCEDCGSEVIVVKAADPDLQCCGKPLGPLVPPGATAGGQKTG